MSALGRSGREGGGTPRSVASSTATGAADLECICAICTCGKHRCPPAPAPRIPFTGYVRFRLAHRVGTRRKMALVAPSERRSRAAAAWGVVVAPPLGACAQRTIARRMCKCAGWVWCRETSYGREFVEHPICRVHCAPAQTYQRVSLPFDGTTTYKAEYHEVCAFPASMRLPCSAGVHVCMSV
ncbi:hypothetical protein EON67_00450 [archaeon]|nr:MAG: hypothetical protein EON67_00450 [archaeon]